MIENEELIEKKNRKRRKYKSMKIWLGAMVAVSAILLTVCVVAGISILNMNGKIDDLTEEVSQTKNQLQTVQLTADELSAKLQILSTERDSLKQERENLAAANAQLTQELETLKNDLSGSGESIEDLQKQIAEKDKTISNLNSKIKTLNNNISKLESQINDLKAQISGEEPEDNPQEEVQNPEDTGKYAYLTFDDGISNATNDILDILKKYDVKATFFVNFAYKKITGYKEIYQRIIDEGHTLGNHTNTHDFDSVYGSIESFEKEVTSIHNSIKELTGYEMTLFRFPGGSNASYVRKLGTAPHELIHDLGYEYYDWNIDSGDTSPKNDPDGDGHNVPKDVLVRNVLNGATSNTAIILVHDLGYRYKRTTVEALPEIIEGLIDKGYTLKALDESVTPIQFTKDPTH
ncbi:MAG: polysaccharide deacetylase family protein [Clostridia bacterium]|nr:polysaccharide deacetylase family protein [Clostridia bacterium]